MEECTAEVAAANRQLLAQIEVREGVEETLRKMQRLDAVGQLTSGVAHDFNNLLTVVLGNIGFLERGLVAQGIDSTFAQRLRNMRRAAERGAKLTDQLLSFSRRQRLEPISLDLNDAVAGMHDLLHSTSFTEFGAAPAKDLLLASAGAEVWYRKGFSIAAWFDGEFAEQSQKYAGTARLRYTW